MGRGPLVFIFRAVRVWSHHSLEETGYQNMGHFARGLWSDGHRLVVLSSETRIQVRMAGRYWPRCHQTHREYVDSTDYCEHRSQLSENSMVLINVLPNRTSFFLFSMLSA